jgi:DNA repair exonuclease SbcCD ATPase subunit
MYSGEGQALVIEEMAFGLGAADPETAGSGDRGVEGRLAAHDEVVRQEGQPPFSPSAKGPDGTGADRDSVERIAGELARTLLAAMRDLLKSVAGEGMTEIKGRVEALYEQFAAANASAQEADKRREAELTNLRQETTNISVSVTDRIQALVSRLEIQEQEVSEVKSAVLNISPRVAAAAERLERQAQAIHSLCQAYSEPQDAVDRLIEALVQWKGSLVTAQGADQATL